MICIEAMMAVVACCFLEALVILALDRELDKAHREIRRLKEKAATDK